MDDQTVVVGSRSLSSAPRCPDYVRTFPPEFLRALLGDPLGTVSVPPSEQRARPSHGGPNGSEEYVPRTELGRRLWEIRKRIVAAGRATMTWEDIERELAERWGGEAERIRAFAKYHRKRCDCPFPPEPDWV